MTDKKKKPTKQAIKLSEKLAKKSKKPNWKGNIILYILFGLIALSFFFSIRENMPEHEQIPLSQVIRDVKADKVKTIGVEGDNVIVDYKNGETFSSRKEPTDSMRQILTDANIDLSQVTLEPRQDTSVPWLDLISTIGIPVAFIIFFVFLFRQARGAQDSVFSFGQSKAKKFNRKLSKVTFDDVAGVEEAKKEVVEIIDFLKNPKKYLKMGARTPKGVLLIGPAGCGKTLLARAIAGEAEVPFFNMAGSEFMEMLVGVGASVTGDTPVLIDDDQGTRLREIGSFVDQFYQTDDQEGVVKARDTYTLGFEKQNSGFHGSTSDSRPTFSRSAWKKVDSVYRHKVDEIFEIEYLGGMLRTTGDHSVFVREQGGVRPKRVDELEEGEILVDLPMKTRRWNQEKGTTEHEIKAHRFPTATSLVFDFWNEDEELRSQYEFAQANVGFMTQGQIAAMIGVPQSTVGNWQRDVHEPRELSRKSVKYDLPEKLYPSIELMKLFGYFTAEGRGTGVLEFTFGSHECDYQLEGGRVLKKGC